MKRKTNLFYLEGPDSKFITFSNYTEALTGNFLSTNTKIFPSKFLCLNIPDLTSENKKSLIKILVDYYESKLAVLRDNVESFKKIKPLNYLLETLMNCTFNADTNEWELYNNNYKDESKIPFKIVYCNDITEQDYNGTYTDTICIVDLGNVISGNVNVKDYEDYDTVQLDNLPVNNITKNPCLYGWENEVITGYESDKSIFDNITSANVGEYYINSFVNSIKLEHENLNELQFNVIIPICDLVDINYKTNFSTIEDEEYSIDDNKEFGIDLTEESDSYIKNIPLGMWFSDKPIELKKDIQTGFSQTWSLTISSQFKPFGYSKYMPSETEQSVNTNAFATFAQVLTKQNELINKFSTINVELNDLKQQVAELSSQVRNIATIYNIENLNKQLINYEAEMNAKFDSFKNEVTNALDNIKWQSTI